MREAAKLLASIPPVAVDLAAALAAALVAGYEALGHRTSLMQPVLLLGLFTVASHGKRRWTAMAAAAVYAELVDNGSHGSLLRTCLISAAWVSAAAVVGEGARRLREYRALLTEYMEQVQRRHSEREQRAVLMERIRIARELHDVTAHHLSVIAVQAGVARFVFDKEPETADRALRAISEVGSEGLAELRRLISLLRPDDDESTRAGTAHPPAPGVAQLPVLIERVGLSGTPSRYTVAGHQRPLPAGIELCVYRVVQESLTNVLKHAPGSSVEVRLEYEAASVRLTVTDTGPHAVPAQRTLVPPSAVTQAARHSGSGVGLTGMRERAALYGGELSAGRTRLGGFEVSLTLPIEAADEEFSDADLAAPPVVVGSGR
jgi:signal transduction histidine kinase